MFSKLSVVAFVLLTLTGAAEAQIVTDPAQRAEIAKIFFEREKYNCHDYVDCRGKSMCEIPESRGRNICVLRDKPMHERFKVGVSLVVGGYRMPATNGLAKRDSDEVEKLSALQFQVRLRGAIYDLFGPIGVEFGGGTGLLKYFGTEEPNSTMAFGDLYVGPLWALLEDFEMVFAYNYGLSGYDTETLSMSHMGMLKLRYNLPWANLYLVLEGLIGHSKVARLYKPFNQPERIIHQEGLTFGGGIGFGMNLW